MTPHQIELLRCAADHNRKLPNWVSGRMPDGRTLHGQTVACELRGLGFVTWPERDGDRPVWPITITQTGRDALAALEADSDVQH